MRAKATPAWITAAWITAACLLLAIPAQAATLQEIYEMAVRNDPQLGAAAATYNSRKEVVSQARAALLPQIGIGASESESKRVILDPLDPAVLAAKRDPQFMDVLIRHILHKSYLALELYLFPTDHLSGHLFLTCLLMQNIKQNWNRLLL